MKIFASDTSHLLVSYLKRWGTKRGRKGGRGQKTKTKKKKNRPYAAKFSSYYDSQPILPRLHHSFASTFVSFLDVVKTFTTNKWPLAKPRLSRISTSRNFRDITSASAMTGFFLHAV